MSSLNGYHNAVCRWLGELGISYMEEYLVEPYSLDIFLPELFLGVEVDGPSHNRKHDAIRDEKIMQQYEIPIIRIKVGTPKKYAMEKILGSYK